MTRIMHVAYIHQHFATTAGATGTRSYEMSRRLIRAGHRVTIVCGDCAVGDRDINTTGRVTEYEVDGIRVLRVAEPYANEMGFVRRLFAFGRFARTATKVVSGLDADLVFATSTPLSVGVPGMKGAKRLGVPFVFEVRDRWPELVVAMGVLKNPLLIWYAERLERRIYAAADRIIALAPGIRDGITGDGYPKSNIDLIPNSADLELFQPSSDPLSDVRFGSPEEFRLVFTGAHGLANGLDAVLDAIAELKRRGAEGLRFVFIGRGSQKQRLVQRSRNDGLESMINWIDPIPKKELATVLPRMDVGLMILRNVPAFYRSTSPNKFFDYLACGLPVLNNYPGWLADLIDQNQCGVAIPPDDPSAFADAVLSLRDNRVKLDEMGKCARTLAEQNFSRDQLGEQFVTALERAAKQ